MALQRLPINTLDITPDALLAHAGNRSVDTPLARLEALLLVDAARWVAWPRALPAADALESQLAGSAPRDETAPGRLLALDLATRHAARHGSLETVASALSALPSGYSVKALWLRWRETLERSHQPALWDRIRQGLSEAVTTHGVPPSETLAALLGWVDLPLWRAQVSLRQTALDLLSEPLRCAFPADMDSGTRRVYQGNVGRWLIALGDESGGARLVHASTEGLPLTRVPHRGRLFSRPSPDAAVWLRQAVERAQLIDGEPRESLLLSALGSLVYLAQRHAAGHLLAETLDPRPVRFDRPDATALVLAEGASAWLTCGIPDRAAEWRKAALKLALRHPRAPLIGGAALALAAYHDRAGLGPADLSDLATRLVGDAKLRLSIELARLRGLGAAWAPAHSASAQPAHESARQALGGLYRLCKTRHHDGHAEPAAALAGALCDLGLAGPGLGLFAAILDPNSSALPAALPHNDVEEEQRAELRGLIAAAHHEPRGTAPLLWSLCRHGHPDLASDLLQQTVSDGLPGDSWARFGGALALAQAVGEGCDPGLLAAVETATREEGARIAERLRIDDPRGSAAPPQAGI